MVSVVQKFTWAPVLAGVATAALLGISVPLHAVDVKVLCELSDPRLTEISGITPSRIHAGVYWVHNDSGDAARIYGIDVSDCDVVAELTMKGVTARDIEGIASSVDNKGRPVLWVGDIGDNLDSWESVSIYRVREPKKLGKKSIKAKQFRFTYDDRPHNAETILADPDSSQLWIVTKQLASGSIYRLPEKLSSTQLNIAVNVGSVGGLVTDGAVNPSGTGFVIRDYFDVQFFAGLPPGNAQNKNALPAQIQGEAITFSPDGDSLVIASENDTRIIEIMLSQDQISDVTQSSGEPIPIDTESEPEPAEVNGSDLNYWPLVAGVLGGIALVTGLIIMSRKPRESTTGNTMNAE